MPDHLRAVEAGVPKMYVNEPYTALVFNFHMKCHGCGEYRIICFIPEVWTCERVEDHGNGSCEGN